MVSVKSSKFLAVVAVALAATGVAAHAATVSNSVNITAGSPITTTGTATAVGSATVTGSLLPFDTTLGTLTDVTITFTVTSASTDIIAHGMTAGPVITSYGKTVTDKATPNISIAAPNAFTFPDAGGISSDNDATATGTATTFTIAVPASGSSTPYAYAGTMALPSLTSTYTLTSDMFSTMTGSSPTDVSFYVYLGGLNSPNLPLQASFNLDSLVGTMGVTYTYTPSAVPEPASLGALGLGAVALLGRRRK